MTDDACDKLSSILQNLAEVRDALLELQESVGVQGLEDLLNSLQPLIDSDNPSLALTSLRALDNSGYSQAEYQERMKSVLTEGLGNGDLDDYGTLARSDNAFDTFCNALWQAMTTTYSVTINGKSQKVSLTQAYYESLRQKYNWEHQAYAEWEEFDTRCISLLASTLSLERASLKMRLELLREYNITHTDSYDEGAVIALLNDTQDHINQMKGYAGEVQEETYDPDKPATKSVDYQGLFNEAAWNSQYWMYKQRPDYRYYWVSGHECLFYAQVNTQDIPGEDTSANLGGTPTATTSASASCATVLKSTRQTELATMTRTSRTPRSTRKSSITRTSGGLLAATWP